VTELEEDWSPDELDELDVVLEAEVELVDEVADELADPGTVAALT
jgi:hypothetical protein